MSYYYEVIKYKKTYNFPEDDFKYKSYINYDIESSDDDDDDDYNNFKNYINYISDSDSDSDE